MPTLKYGRRPTPHEVLAVQPRLRAYLPALPAAPATVDYSAGIGSWPMFLNDQLGDCLIAGQGHMAEVFTHEVDGRAKLVTDNDILKGYEGLGYIPGDSDTDQGGTCVQALTAWRERGLAGDQILGWASVPLDQAHIQAATWLFSGLYCGLAVPQSAEDQFQAGQPWTVVQRDGGIIGGHCVPIVGYDDQGVTVVTWGQLQRASWAFVASYFDESYAVLPSDYSRLAGRALPCDLDLEQLVEDIDALGGNVPEPSPGPRPTPVPPEDVIRWLEAEAERLPEPARDWVERFLAWAEQHQPRP